MDAAARTRMAQAIKQEKLEARLTALRRRAERLYAEWKAGQLGDEDYRRQGAEIKAEATALGYRLVPYHRGSNCISLMMVEATANEHTKGEWRR